MDNKDTVKTPYNHTPNAWALFPLVVFLFTYLVVSILAGDFYKMPITVAFSIASVVAIAQSKGGKLNNRIEQFCRGAANSNILLMVLIFILAGSFCPNSQSDGRHRCFRKSSLVHLTRQSIGSRNIYHCVFYLAIGRHLCRNCRSPYTRCGRYCSENGTDLSLMVGAVVGGAMFGDNLSFISDTTIVATRTQGCNMSDKFKANVLIALPVAVATTLIYIITSQSALPNAGSATIDWIKVIPYLVVLITAISGVNVILVLLIGIVLSGFVGLLTGGFGIWEWTASMGLGINNMGELIIVTLLAGGILEMIRFNGGIDWIILKLTSHVRTARGAELSIAGLVSFANLCTANNTIALIMAGPIAKDIATNFNIPAKDRPVF